jgi:hypothetical protein
LPHISDFGLLIDLFLQILEDVRIDVSRGLWFRHGGVHHTLKADEGDEMRNALLWYPATERLDYEIATLRLLLVRWLDHGSLRITSYLPALLQAL